MMEEGQERVQATYRRQLPAPGEIKSKYDPENFFRVVRKLYSNSSITISGFDPRRSGGPHVPAPLEVKTCILPIWLKP